MFTMGDVWWGEARGCWWFIVSIAFAFLVNFKWNKVSVKEVYC